MPYIILTANGEELHRAALSGPTIVGRSPECDVSVRDILLSRRHCRLEPARGQHRGRWRLVDLNSRNGSHVNWKKVSQYTLVDGDVVRIGRTWLTFRTGAFQPAPPQTPQSATGRNRVVRPADPHEALSGTVAAFVLEPLDAGAQEFDATPSPRGQPAEVTSMTTLASPQTELSSSWDSIVATANRPRRMARPIPRPVGATLGTPLGARQMSDDDLSLQACAAQVPYLQIIPPLRRRRANLAPALILSLGIAVATLLVLASGWVMTQ